MYATKYGERVSLAKGMARAHMSCQIKVRKDSGIMEALESACEKQNIKQSEYLRLAVAERLEEEGYETGYTTSSTNNA